MSIKLQDTKKRVREVEGIGMKDRRGRYRTAYILKMNVNGVWRTIWELIKGWVFTSDDYAIETNDGYMIKCNDQ